MHPCGLQAHKSLNEGPAEPSRAPDDQYGSGVIASPHSIFYGSSCVLSLYCRSSTSPPCRCGPAGLTDDIYGTRTD